MPSHSPLGPFMSCSCVYSLHQLQPLTLDACSLLRHNDRELDSWMASVWIHCVKEILTMQSEIVKILNLESMGGQGSQARLETAANNNNCEKMFLFYCRGEL